MPSLQIITLCFRISCWETDTFYGIRRPRCSQESVTGFHLGMLQDSPHLDILFFKINQEASHPPKCAWDSNLTSSFHVFRLSFYVHPSHPPGHAAYDAFPTPLVWRLYGNTRCIPRIMNFLITICILLPLLPFHIHNFSPQHFISNPLDLWFSVGVRAEVLRP